MVRHAPAYCGSCLSTGYSDSRFVRWYDVRTGSVKIKKGWIKMHSIIDIPTREVLDYLVTDRNVADITGLRTMLERFEGALATSAWIRPT